MSAWPASVGGVDVIVVANLVEVAAFETIVVGNDFLLFLEVKILVELADGYVAYALSDINLTIVEEHARVVVAAREFLDIPLALGVGGCEQPALQAP